MWPWAELDHGLVEVIFSANGSRTSLLSARVRRQAHYSSILPLQASGIICYNRVWHDRTTECIKILLASQASSPALVCAPGGGLMRSPRALASYTEVLWQGVGEGGSSKGSSPVAWRKKPGKEFMGCRPTGVCVSGHPRQAGAWLPCARNPGPTTVPTAVCALSLSLIQPPWGRLSNRSFSKESPGYVQVSVKTWANFDYFVDLWSDRGRKHGSCKWQNPCSSMQLDWTDVLVSPAGNGCQDLL